MREIPVKTKEEIEIMARAGKILALILDSLKKEIRAGRKTKDLDLKARQLINFYKVKPAFLGYDNFPAALCVSVNDIIVHGAPSEYRLKEGDIVSLDLGIEYKDFFSDMAITLPVGNVDAEAIRLIKVTKKALKRAIKKTKPGNTFGDIGNTIQRYIQKRGFFIIKELCGHGIGKDLHEPPEVLNYGKRNSGSTLREGMVFCIEPMASISCEKIKKADDICAFKTADNSFSAHFEHTVAVTRNGAKILTKI